MKKKIKYVVEELFITNGTNDIEKRKNTLEDIIVKIIKKEKVHKLV